MSYKYVDICVTQHKSKLFAFLNRQIIPRVQIALIKMVTTNSNSNLNVNILEGDQDMYYHRLAVELQ